jgi:Ribbon-helix-helix protein, copG family
MTRKRRRSQRAYMRRYNCDRRRYARQYRMSKERWHYQSMRLDHDDIAELRERAKRERTSVPELVRRYITWGLEDDYRGDRE